MLNKRFADHYNRELYILRGLGKEYLTFLPNKKDHPGADQQGLDAKKVLEAAAFLAARVQFKLEEQFPRFAQNLLETIYPNYLAPMPCVLVVQCQIPWDDPSLAKGWCLPKSSGLKSSVSDLQGREVICQFRTQVDLMLWPLKSQKIHYDETHDHGVQSRKILGTRGSLVWSVSTCLDVFFSSIPLDRLRVFLGGELDTAYRLYDLLGTHLLGIKIHAHGLETQYLDVGHVVFPALEAAEALLPPGIMNLDGHRLLQGYFACPEQYLFFEIIGLSTVLKKIPTSELTIEFCFDQYDQQLFDQVTHKSFLLHCVPAINLFEKRLDRLTIKPEETEWPVVVDHQNQQGYEIYDFIRVLGLKDNGDEQEFFSASQSVYRSAVHGIPHYFYRRELLHGLPHLHAPQTQVPMWLSLADPQNPPYSKDLKQLQILAHCTNGAWPLNMLDQKHNGRLLVETDLAIRSIQLIHGPSHPQPSSMDGESAWPLLALLGQHYFSVLQGNQHESGLQTFKTTLSLHAKGACSHLQHQLEAIYAIHSQAVTVRWPHAGPVCFVRGVEITLVLDESGFNGMSIFLFCQVIEKFLQRYVGMNTMTRLICKNTRDTEICKFAWHTGQRYVA